MNRKSLATGAFLGTLSSLVVIGLMYLGEQAASLPFVPFDVFDWLTRVLPGDVLTFTIDLIVGIISFLNLGDTSTAAKAAEQIIAILQLIAGGAVFGLVLSAIYQKRPKGLTSYGIIGGLLLLAVTLIIEDSLGFPQAGVAFSSFWLAFLFIVWGWLLSKFIIGIETRPAVEAEETPSSLSRRQFLSITGFGALALSLSAVGLGRLLREDDETFEDVGEPEEIADLPEASPTENPDPFGVSETSGPAASPSLEELAARPEPASGTRPELTSNDDFYRIDINTRPVRVDTEEWSLEVFGLVDNPLSLTLEDLHAFPAFTQILTMQCISNPVGGDLTGTTRWTGVRLKDVLDQAGMQSDAQEVIIQAADDFHESVKMQDIMDDRTLLVYEMNGVPLPVEHGFPLRVYIPNRYGMKQPKWIESLEVIDSQHEGFWVQRGWSPEAIANTTSVVDTVSVDTLTNEAGEAQVVVGGIAWAGARGIERVEVQVDDGAWNEAQLLSPPLSPLSWVQWRYDWPHQSGRHKFSVRCFDGTGDLQTTEGSSARPNGATGIHSLTVQI